MKTVYLLAFCFISIGAIAQTDLSRDKILIGELKGDKASVVIDTKSFLKEFNKHFPDMDYNAVEINSQYTIGEKKEMFYYVDVYSSNKDAHVVRWLNNENGRLYIDNTFKNDFTHKNFYVSCVGVESCKPNLYAMGNELNWICGETPGCVTEEEAKRNPCAKSTSVITP